MKGGKRKRRSTTEDPQEAFVSKLVDRALKKKTKELHQLKGVDVYTGDQQSLATLNTSGSSHVLTVIQLGDGLMRRGDDSVKMQSLRLRMALRYQYARQALTDNIKGNLTRVTVVQIKNPGATLPAWNDIFKITGNDGLLYDSFAAGVRLGKSSEYRVLRDEMFDWTPRIDNQTGLAGHYMTDYQHVDWFIPLRDMELKYDSTNSDGSYAAIEKNAIVVYVRSRESDTHSAVWFDVNARVRYVDN